MQQEAISEQSEQKNQYFFPFILITSLFFLWGIANSMNGILIKHFQVALNLNRTQAGFIDTAFYLGYFVMAIPAGLLMQKYGYKKGILLGLALYALGALLFYPAAEIRTYSFFLIALFVIASGLAFLETAANPYISTLGHPSKAAQRINFAQSFNGLSIILGPVIGALFVFGDKEYSNTDLLKLSATQAEAIRLEEAHTVQGPYIGLAVLVFLVLFLFWITKMPEPNQTTHNTSQNWLSIFKNKHLVWGIIAQFCYVGTQASIWGYFIDYKLYVSPTHHFFGVSMLKDFFEFLSGNEDQLTNTRWAAFHLSFCLTLFMIGRFAGTTLMTKIKPQVLLTIFATLSMLLICYAIAGRGLGAVIALTFVNFFMSIMFPTIFALSTKNLGEQVKLGSSLIIMSIVGGALLPPIFGQISEAVNIQVALILPLVCFIVIAYFSVWGHQVKSMD